MHSDYAKILGFPAPLPTSILNDGWWLRDDVGGRLSINSRKETGCAVTSETNRSVRAQNVHKLEIDRSSRCHKAE